MRVGVDTRFRTVAFVDGQGTVSGRSDYSYRADELRPGRYFFRLRQIDFDGQATTSPQIEAIVEIPGSFELSAAYPNPFNPNTLLELTVQRTQRVVVTVVDAAGREVATLYEGEAVSQQPLTLDFRADHLPSGLYVVKASGELFSTARTVTLLR